MWLPGHKVTQEASFSWLAKYSCGAGPISASHACATVSPNPSIDFSSPSSRRYGSALTAILASRPPTAVPDSAIRSRCSRHSAAWWSVNRPVSAADRSASFPAVRIRPIARSASTCPRRSPSISPSIISVADLPVSSDTTEAGLDPRRFQRLGQPLDLRGARLHGLDPVAGQVPQVLERLRRDVAAAQQPALEQLRQPQAVLRVRLVPLQRLGMRRVDHRDPPEALPGQRVIHRLGIHPAGLHHHVGDAPPAQVRGHRQQHPVKGPVLQHLRGAGPRPVSRPADPDLDHVLVHVDPGDPLKHHSHTPARLLQRLTSHNGEDGPPAGAPRSVQETDTRARSGNGGYPTRGSSTKLKYGLKRTKASR